MLKWLTGTSMLSYNNSLNNFKIIPTPFIPYGKYLQRLENMFNDTEKITYDSSTAIVYSSVLQQLMSSAEQALASVSLPYSAILSYGNYWIVLSGHWLTQHSHTVQLCPAAATEQCSAGTG